MQGFDELTGTLSQDDADALVKDIMALRGIGVLQAASGGTAVHRAHLGIDLAGDLVSVDDFTPVEYCRGQLCFRILAFRDILAERTLEKAQKMTLRVKLNHP